MRKRTSRVIVTLVIVTGVALLLYPTVSKFLKTQASRQVISYYTTVTEQLDDDNYEELLSAAHAYNERLAARGEFMILLSESEKDEYYSLMDISDGGVMGYVTIPKLELSLPIYHGTEEDVLQSGVGHLEISSLPVGGMGTHAVLTAHTGLPSAKLFTGIDQLVEGDTFSIQVLKDTLTYEVDQIMVVLPDEAELLLIESDKDYCTLVTCTPYGVNSHRLLVRGQRVPTPLAEAVEAAKPDSGPAPGDADNRMPDHAVELTLLIIAIPILVVLLQRNRIMKRIKRLKKEEESIQDPPEA